jgi:hypothetical protein
MHPNARAELGHYFVRANQREAKAEVASFDEEYRKMQTMRT